MLKASGLLNI